jgi:hypothetical protein
MSSKIASGVGRMRRSWRKIEQARKKPATVDKADRIKGGKILPWNFIVNGD